jgi:hypothetical protein
MMSTTLPETVPTWRKGTCARAHAIRTQAQAVPADRYRATARDPISMAVSLAAQQENRCRSNVAASVD